MKSSHLLAALLMTLSAAVACAPPRAAMSDDSAPSNLENVQWTLIELDGAAITARSHGAPTITFVSKELRAQGFAGCNRFSGGYQLDGSQLRIGPLATTRMACPDGSAETALLKALQETASWKIDGRRLELLDGSAAARTRWTVTAIETGEKP